MCSWSLARSSFVSAFDEALSLQAPRTQCITRKGLLCHRPRRGGLTPPMWGAYFVESISLLQSCILVVTPKGETLHQRLLSYKSMSRNYYYYMLNSTVCICARRMPRLRRRRSEAQKASITYCTEPSVQSPSLTERKLPLTGLASLFSIVRDCLRFV